MQTAALERDKFLRWKIWAKLGISNYYYLFYRLLLLKLQTVNIVLLVVWQKVDRLVPATCRRVCALKSLFGLNVKNIVKATMFFFKH